MGVIRMYNTGSSAIRAATEHATDHGCNSRMRSDRTLMVPKESFHQRCHEHQDVQKQMAMINDFGMSGSM